MSDLDTSEHPRGDRAADVAGETPWVAPDGAHSKFSAPAWWFTAVDALVVAGCCLFTFWQLHPADILSATTPTGGDMGAHVWAFGYLRDTLLPAGQLAGWTPDWYAGFPAFHFYMVVPFLGMVALNAGLGGAFVVLPAAVALALAAFALGLRHWLVGALAAAAAVGFGLNDPDLVADDVASFVLVVGAVVLAGVAFVHPGRFAPAHEAGTPLAEPRVNRGLAVAAIVIAIVGVPFSFGASFKLIAVSGVVLMPAAAYAFGRLARLPTPAPTVLAVTTVAFTFDTNFTIYGGNIASTMAGEFAFSIAVALALVYLGVLIRGLADGTHRATAAVLLALVGLCHLLPAFFALAATAVILIVHLVREPSVTRRHVAIGVGTTVAVVLLAGGVAALADLATTPVVLVLTGVALVLTLMVGAVRHPLGAETIPAATDAEAPSELEASPPLRGRLWWLTSAGAVAGLLSAFWVLPFFLRRTYLNDMGWEKISVHREGQALWSWFSGDVLARLIPNGSAGVVDHTPTDLRVWLVLAGAGAILGFVYRRGVTIALTITGLVLATAFVYAPQGRLWNARILPFWYLVVYLLAAIGIAEIFRAVGEVLSGRPEHPRRAVTVVAAPLAAVCTLGFLAAELHQFPLLGGSGDDGGYEVGIGPIAVDVDGKNIATDWSAWNFSGYEAKDAYPEYRAIVETMADVGRDHGCGRSLWEYNPDLDSYGTPMALMLLPHWTDGCIGSMEGLYFEASSTTPFHFLVQSELSTSSSRAQRDMPYRDFDLDEGVRHLQMMGVKYYLTYTPEATDAARTHEELTELADSVHWVVFEVADAPLVEGVSTLPAVTTASDSQHEWLCRELDESDRCTGAALDHFQDPAQDGQILAADGPDEWPRVEVGEEITPVAVEEAVVSDIVESHDSISFTVDQPGTPVLVKTSYFPNWSASGADGPWRVAPNLMVVVPTDTEVELRYARTGIDYASIGLSLIGLALVLTLAHRRLYLPRLVEPDVYDPEADHERGSGVDDAAGSDATDGSGPEAADAETGSGSGGSAGR